MLPPHATLSNHVIKCCEELNEHYDGTTIQIHFLSFSTDISSNKVFTYKETMNQEDAHLFVEAMQKKEVADHELQDHWTIVPHSTVPKTAKPIHAIWSFKRKRRPDVHLPNIKQDYVLMVECNNGEQITGRHIHQ